jgi:hypothetical protein
MKIGRVVLGVVMGFLFFLFIAIDLFLFGVIPLDSVVITLLPLLGALTGGVLAWLAAKQQAASTTAPAGPRGGGVDSAPAATGGVTGVNR